MPLFHLPTLAVFGIVAVLVLAVQSPLVYATSLSSTSLPFTQRDTTRNDLIGLYVLHENASLAADIKACPQNLTAETFVFEKARAPSSLAAPKEFNIQIPHVNTKIDDFPCARGGSIIVTHSSHPFAQTPPGALQAWAAGGRRIQASWISDDFLDDVDKWPWAVGFDFAQRTCRGSSLPPGVGFLWFQPRLTLFLGKLQLSGTSKYLTLTFGNRPKAGCVYVAEKVGGQPPFPVGPVSDPTNPNAPDDSPTGSTGANDTGSNSDDDDDTDDSDSSNPGPSSGDSSTPDDSGGNPSGASPSPAAKPSPNGPGGATAPPLPPGEAVQNDVGQPLGPSPGSASSSTQTSTSECFPGTARVALADGSIIKMGELERGQKVMTGVGASATSEDVILFSHKTSEHMGDFLNVSTGQRSLVISAGHYVHIGRRLVAARTLRIGDGMTMADGTIARILSIEKTKGVGLFAPHTTSGEMIVDGVRVSCYTEAVDPRFAHKFMMPLMKRLYDFGLSWMVERVIADGAPRLASLLPSGPNNLGHEEMLS